MSVWLSQFPYVCRLLAAAGPELSLLGLGLLAFLLFPSDLGFLTRVNIMALFVLSLAVVLGQAGIATLGQAALFGSGAYVAGLWALHVSAEPLTGLVAGASAGAAAAAVTGALLLRTHGLTFLMLSIAVAQLLFEIANKAAWLTGGDDGLSGIKISPVLGLFRFDFLGRTGYWYSLAILVVVYCVLRRVAASPFGLTCRGIRSDRTRMLAIGCPVYRHLMAVYILGGGIAGVAGALSAQTTRVVGLNSLSFELSAEGLIMLVLGGSAKLAGALIGTPLFMVVHHVASTVNPYHWLFVIGALLIVTVVALPNGMVELAERVLPAAWSRAVRVWRQGTIQAFAIGVAATSVRFAQRCVDAGALGWSRVRGLARVWWTRTYRTASDQWAAARVALNDAARNAQRTIARLSNRRVGNG
jgi:branched-chain amino acid transport system permease protein